MSDVIETDYTTEPPMVIEREFTEAELAQQKIDLADAKKEKKAEADKEQARADAIAHAKSLGFTDAMIAVMYPNLGA